MAAAPTAGVDLAFSGMSGQAELIRGGEVTSRELVELSLERIFRLDQRINAFRVVFADQALAEADQADARRRAGDQRPLLGVPIAIKDDQDVAGEVTTFGTLAHGGPAPADSEIVRRLRSAGAVIVGKTNVPELTITPWTETPAWGATRNPWDLDRTPGGSSGGSAAAVAAGLVAGATASDGAGSIRIPAGCCGLVGLKTQRGRVPIAPLENDWHGMTVFGTVTRTVADTALFYDVVKDSGPSFADAARQEPGRLRIALSFKIPKPMMGRVDDDIRRGMDSLVERLRGLGHEVVERDPDYGTAVLGVIARYLRGIADAGRAMHDPARLAPTTKGFVRMGSLIPAAAVAKARAAEAADAARFNAIFGDGIDLVLTPATTSLPLRIGRYPQGTPAPWVFNQEAAFTPYEGIANHTGQPAIVVPGATTPDGFPIGAQFLAPADGEPRLLALAAQLEREIGWPQRRPAAAA
jgi:amidase